MKKPQYDGGRSANEMGAAARGTPLPPPPRAVPERASAAAALASTATAATARRGAAHPFGFRNGAALDKSRHAAQEEKLLQSRARLERLYAAAQAKKRRTAASPALALDAEASPVERRLAAVARHRDALARGALNGFAAVKAKYAAWRQQRRTAAPRSTVQ